MASVGFTALDLLFIVPSVDHTCFWLILLLIVTTAAWTSCCPQSLLLLEVFPVPYSSWALIVDLVSIVAYSWLYISVLVLSYMCPTGVL
jgi:hypothetical protein